MSFEDVPSDPSLADPLPTSPLELIARWLREAQEGRVQRNPGAMTVATLGSDGTPAARVVLCRGFDPEHGYVVFHTNRRSHKGRELAAHARAAAVIHWDALQRQIRMRGPVLESPDEESDAYFDGRPRPAQIAAWASQQSEPIATREALLEKLAEQERRFGGASGGRVPRPPHWGGYRLFLESVELWVGAEGRAHDRVLWQRQLARTGDGYAGSAWTMTRLQP